ncbi:Crp/Fnr family transcriptional regulator [Bradyrhizobium sp. vgs-9]|jgi:CRP/FNR family cyclic AMP-dependent transcriptional regulator|uniref:Crp/Fnr family transcriptional regulator n=1 Tax=Bradyrhizobium sp. vgs-9 TaxID=208389 RepID=UPI0035D417D9
MKKPDKKNTFDPQAFLALVGAGKSVLNFTKGRIIFTQGDAANSVLFIQSGKVKMTVVSEEGKEAVVGIFEPGQFFGEGCLNGHSVRIATAKALEPSVITSIAKKTMLAVLNKEPKFSQLFMTYLLTRNTRIEEDLIDQLFNSSEKRLARLLLLLANFGKEGKPTPIETSINQETLAEMIGTTRSRVSFFLNKFRKLGLISYNGKLVVHRSLLNAVLHDKPAINRDDSQI